MKACRVDFKEVRYRGDATFGGNVNLVSHPPETFEVLVCILHPAVRKIWVKYETQRSIVHSTCRLPSVAKNPGMLDMQMTCAIRPREVIAFLK